MSARSVLAVACAVLLLSGCALASKGEPLRPRYFEPELARPPTQIAANAASTGLRLRLGRIEASSYLREPIAFRNSAEELGYDENRRWTERPEQYLRRELERALFEEHGFVRALGGDVPTLEAELIDFSEDRANRVARLRIAVLLHDDSSSLFEQTIEITRPIAHADGRDEATEIVRALAAALNDAVERVSAEVTRKLEAAPGLADAEK